MPGTRYPGPTGTQPPVPQETRNLNKSEPQNWAQKGAQRPKRDRLPARNAGPYLGQECCPEELYFGLFLKGPPPVARGGLGGAFLRIMCS